MEMKQAVQTFFDAYEDRFNKSLQDPPTLDVGGVTAAFADCFIEASPVGVSCGQNDAAFRENVPKGFAFYKEIGTTSMKITSLTITPLNDQHVMAKVHWDSHYQKKSGDREQIEFDVIYFLQMLGDAPKIFAYITGDEQRVLKERGLI